MLCFIFAIQKMFQLLWKIFFIPSLCILEKKVLLTNIRNKYVIKEVNLYFCDVIEMAKFFLQLFIIFNIITDSFLIEKWGTLEHARGCLYRNLSIVRKAFILAFFKLLENKESFGKSFSFPFSVKRFDRNFKCSFKFLILYFAIS